VAALISRLIEYIHINKLLYCNQIAANTN